MALKTVLSFAVTAWNSMKYTSFGHTLSIHCQFFLCLQAMVPFQALQAFANQLSVCQNFMDE
jgi:hypothetical protein